LSNEVIEWKDLLKYFPKLDGWEKKYEKGETATLPIIGAKYSKIWSEYTKGSKKIKYTLIDTSYNKFNLLIMRLKAEKDGTDGYVKHKKEGNFEQWNEYNYNAKKGKISLFIKERIKLTCEGENVDENDLTNCLATIDLNSLSNLVPQ
jgi:hypothetical protein